ncbi:MAG: 50S ribosomal protein L3 [archaeon]|nr:MAG: 50S ribosomal protein L3 [archaeon]
MGKIHKPRAGSLQIWPRKRASKLLPSVNWIPLEQKHSDKKLLGFVGYRVGMLRVLARDLTADSLTKNRQIIIPTTVVEVPPIKIISVRFYKKDDKGFNVSTEVLAPNLDKELKKKLKVPKKKEGKKLDDFEKRLEEFDDLRIIIHTVAKKTKKKKTPDFAEIGLGGSIKEKFEFVKANLGKELEFRNFFEKGSLVDVKALTKGKGFVGPVKRFGIGLKDHKSEKGRRRPGSLAPWNPSRVTFRAPQAGQLGMFTRQSYNKKILDFGLGEELHKNVKGFKGYGNVNTTYLLIRGSVQGSVKRPIIFTYPLRESKKTKKKNFEIVKILQ